MWRVAGIQYALGERVGAAMALVAVAREAERYGEPALQARALFEAAVHYAAAEKYSLSVARMKRLEPLLGSPHVSSDFRGQVERRLEG
jgi:hypothetical protein